MAVGSFVSLSGTTVPFSEQWNGTSWTSIPVSAPQYSYLNAVTCFESSDCIAVGSTRYGTLSEQWNGTDWAIVPSPAPKGEIDSALTGMSCVSPSSCESVGYYANSKSTYLTLAATWNGAKWVRVASPNPKGVNGSELFGVSCVSTGSCVAVGSSFSGAGNTHTLAETWDGGTWTLVTSANEHPGQENSLGDVNCSSATDCIAVGSYFARSGSTFPLIEQWNGTSWAIVTGPGNQGALLGVDCSSASSCMAVGESPSGTFTEMKSGSTWKVEKSPNPKGAGHDAVLVAVSCARATRCEAVGYDTGKGSDTTYNLIESWNGSEWQIVKSAKP